MSPTSKLERLSHNYWGEVLSVRHSLTRPIATATRFMTERTFNDLTASLLKLSDDFAPERDHASRFVSLAKI